MKDVYLKFVAVKDSTVREILTKEFDISARLLRKLKLNKRICCNKKDVWIDYPVKSGDEVCVNISFEECSDAIKAQDGRLDVLYEDDCLLIINKIGNMVVHPTCIHQEGTLANYVKKYLKSNGENIKIRFVNRIDRETSGIVILAKNEYTQDILTKQMQEGTFKKQYIAIVHGIIQENFGTINFGIKRDPDSIMTRVVAEDGERAVTHYEVTKRLNDMTVIKLQLETGRTHQIRVHCKEIGHPILADGLYSEINTDLITRQALHAYRVEFNHPISGKKINIEAEIPEDMRMLIKL